VVDVARDFAATGGLWIEVAAPAYALVRAPMLATLRHVGRLRGRGLTAVLEPRAGELIVLSGLGSVDRAPGEALAAGEPLGAMGGPPPAADEFLIDASAMTGTIPQETLYIEVRRAGAPVDPATWFPAAAAGAGPDEPGTAPEPAAQGFERKGTNG
jgi:septal ring factor EnvC (AmiA/AmiB activator)